MMAVSYADSQQQSLLLSILHLRRYHAGCFIPAWHQTLTQTFQASDCWHLIGSIVS